MLSHIAAGSNQEFINLNRSFHELVVEKDVLSDDFNIRKSFGFNDSLNWSDLLNRYRVVILSEAGSGKTVEIQNITHKLRDEGKDAFFMRLEHIPSDFDESFEVGTLEEFNSWLTSNDEGWLLLDSVDEARLRSPRDFELAIRKLSKKISKALERVHIVITGRTSAWRPKSDLTLCASHLPFNGTLVEEEEQKEDKEVVKKEEPHRHFKIVALDDLSSKQVELFLREKGVSEPQVFLDKVERADAWSFTTRPLDLEELIEYWLDNGKIGSRLEIISNSIDRRLSESKQDYSDCFPLASNRAREGARWVAATSILTRNPVINVPDGRSNNSGLPIKNVLSDWNDQEQSTLLSRPIFDEAIYGTVRFHHRSVKEFLSAEWFAELLSKEAFRRRIESEFFRNQYGIEVIVPTLRPVLPWLCILDEKISRRVRKLAPEVFFEGGDPQRLPKDIRCEILRDVCAKMDKKSVGRSMHDYAAVQRFASKDLTEEVCSLIKTYSHNDELLAFLFRMVWIGQLKGAKSLIQPLALSSKTEKYVRINAFRALKAIGDDHGLEGARKAVLNEVDEVKRCYLGELIKGGPCDEVSIGWLLECIDKLEPEEPHSYDGLEEYITEFIVQADIELLPTVVKGLNERLQKPPVIERRYCEVSESHQWLFRPASKAVEKLILARHPASLDHDSLSIFHKYRALRDYGSYRLSEIRTEFSKLVPEWKELNRAAFWFDVSIARKAIEQESGKRLTEAWQVGYFRQFWQFGEDDLDYAAEQIAQQAFLDNKLIALSLAFELYKNNGRPKNYRLKLKKLVCEHKELSQQLEVYLHPPALTAEQKKRRRRDAQWKKRDEAHQKKEQKYHDDWKQYLSEHLGDDRDYLINNPGELTNSLLYLYDQTRKDQSHGYGYTSEDWKLLVDGYGEEVAAFYRDSLIHLWRTVKLQLCSEGGAINERPYVAILGLIGIEIEASNTPAWAQGLSCGDIDRACLFSRFELNGFPQWLPDLYQAHPEIVGNFLIREVSFELSIEDTKKDTHYMISTLRSSGEWAWNGIGDQVLQLLQKEPQNLYNLSNLLIILHGGNSVSDSCIEKLAQRKCLTLSKHDHLAYWYAVWTGVAPQNALPNLRGYIESFTSEEEQTLFAMDYISKLLSDRIDHGIGSRDGFKVPEYLQILHLLMHKYIRAEDDIRRAGTGVYSPGLRDFAQNARDQILNLLNQVPGKATFLALNNIAINCPLRDRHWISLKAKVRAEKDSDSEAWPVLQVREFHQELDRTPRNHKELAELAVYRLLDLKDDLEHADDSTAQTLSKVIHETEMRNYIGRELREKARGRYSIPQEEEFADAKRADLRFHGSGFDGPVPVELKLADNWNGPKLFERLENQLCGDYLRDNRSSRGVFVLVYRGEKKNWELPDGGKRVGFTELVQQLKSFWNDLSPRYPQIDEVSVIGIDLTLRAQ